MSDKYNVHGFNKDQNYELQIKNRGKRTGITFEFQEDLQKYIDEGIFVDELEDGFTIKEKRNLAETFLEIHKEKGYNTNFGKMKKDAKFTYTADEYIRLAKAAGYVLKDMSPEEEAMLKKQIEISANEFAQTDVSEPLATVGSDPVSDVAVTPEESVVTPTAPVEVKTPEAAEDPFKLHDDDPVFKEVKVERVNVDELPAAEMPDEEKFTVKLPPRTYLKRRGIKQEDFTKLPLEQQSQIYREFAESSKNLEKSLQKANKRSFFSRIFVGKKPEDV